MVVAIYRRSAGFPKEEQYGLASQIRRSAVSVPANIAEGFAWADRKEKLHFYNIAQGSHAELRYFLILANDLGYDQDLSALLEECGSIAKMLQALTEKVRSKA